MDKNAVKDLDEVELLAEKEQGAMNKLCLAKLLQVPEGQRKLI